MTAVSLPAPRMPSEGNGYGHARMPRGATAPEPEHIDRVAYGRFRNVYLYITEACQLRCEHCYMGERLDRALKMPLPRIIATLATWRRLGGSKLTILGGEPTLHPDYCASIRAARQLGYEHVITTTNAQAPALRKFRSLEPDDFAYVQVSLDGGGAVSHDAIRGEGTFNAALATTAELAQRGFDTRIICTVNQANRGDVLNLLDIADELGASLVKFHVFSTIGIGHGNPELAMTPPEWVEFCDHLSQVAKDYRTRVWYQPTYAPAGPDGALPGRGLPRVHRADAGPHLDLPGRALLRLLLPLRHRPLLRPHGRRPGAAQSRRQRVRPVHEAAGAERVWWLQGVCLHGWLPGRGSRHGQQLVRRVRRHRARLPALEVQRQA